MLPTVDTRRARRAERIAGGRVRPTASEGRSRLRFFLLFALYGLRVSTVGSIVILLLPAIRGRRGGWNKGFDTGLFRVVFRSGTQPEV